MVLENTPTIKTQRLILRKFRETDVHSFLEIMSDETVNTYLPWFPIATIEEAAAALEERCLSQYQKPSAYHYAICLEDGIPIGYINVGNEPNHDLGYGLRKEFWHKGITTEAAIAVVSRVKEAGYRFITATHDVNNPRSGEVMKKLGMTYRYSYVEQWQPKNISVTFRMYQINFNASDEATYMGYWETYSTHFIEQSI